MATGQPWGGSYATERKRVVWLVFVAGLLLWYLLPRLELELARARWRSHGIEDYDITASASSHGAMFCSFRNDYTLGVRGGELRQVEGTSVVNGRIVSSLGPCPAAVTVEEQFEKMEEVITYFPSSPLMWYTVRYDPTYGFVREFHTDCLVMLHCFGHYTFTNFRPVPPGSQ